MTLTAYKSEMNPWLYGERENPRELENIKGLDDTKSDRCVWNHITPDCGGDDFLFAVLARMLFSAY